MTERLYYTDAALRTFDATVVSSEPANGGHVVVLDRTAFYPTSGGQPFDTGTLSGSEVTDVIDREDGSIAHVLGRPLDVGQRVTGDINWTRRLDHMQQHTGQHILSASFDRQAGNRTVSFHMGADTSTIDLAREVTSEEVTAAEAEASLVAFEDRVVSVRFASDEEAARLPLRKESARTGTLRLVDVNGFDLSACGGTHVARTGIVGLIAVTGVERFKGGSRVSFVCGGRALRSHARLRDVVLAATRLLSIGAGELPAAIERLQGELKALTRGQRELQMEVASHRAADLRGRAEAVQGLGRLVLSDVPGWDASAIKTLATSIVSEPGYVAVLAGDGTPAPVVIARSSDVDLDVGAWLKAVIQTLGGRGGGRPDIAQGGIAAEAARVLTCARACLPRPKS